MSTQIINNTSSVPYKKNLKQMYGLQNVVAKY